jgi:hypothetical protein
MAKLTGLPPSWEQVRRTSYETIEPTWAGRHICSSSDPTHGAVQTERLEVDEIAYRMAVFVGPTLWKDLSLS